MAAGVFLKQKLHVRVVHVYEIETNKNKFEATQLLVINMLTRKHSPKTDKS